MDDASKAARGRSTPLASRWTSATNGRRRAEQLRRSDLRVCVCAAAAAAATAAHTRTPASLFSSSDVRERRVRVSALLSISLSLSLSLFLSSRLAPVQSARQKTRLTDRNGSGRSETRRRREEGKARGERVGRESGRGEVREASGATTAEAGRTRRVVPRDGVGHRFQNSLVGSDEPRLRC